MEKKELVGISLKKIESGDIPKFKIYNVDSSKLLTALKAFTELEMFDMKDIHFELRNVFGIFPGKGGAPAATTYVSFGNVNKNAAKFLISITRSTSQLGWDTSVPTAKGAKAGQSPVRDVMMLLNEGATGVTFENRFDEYPSNLDKWREIVSNPQSPKHKLYKKWFNFVYKHSKNDYKTKVDFEEWIDGVYGAYKIRAKVGKTKLALLNFWYDALKNHDDDPEFWTDILYFGMKITTKGQFAPYSKIS